MTKRQITINAYPLNEVGPNSYSVSISFGEKTPSKRFDIDTIADCKAALAAFAEELQPSGKPWHLSVMFDKRSGRKPAGFDKASNARELQCQSIPTLPSSAPPDRTRLLAPRPESPRFCGLFTSIGETSCQDQCKALPILNAAQRPAPSCLRTFPGQAIKPRIVTVAYVQSNAAVFPPNGCEATREILARIAENPHRHGSWFWFPKASRCRFEGGAMIVLDQEQRPVIALMPVSDSGVSAQTPITSVRDPEPVTGPPASG